MSDRGKLRYNEETRIKDVTKFKKKRVYFHEDHISCEKCGNKVYINQDGDPEVCSECGFDPLYPAEEEQYEVT